MDLGTAVNNMAFVHTCDRQQCPIPPCIMHTVLLVTDSSMDVTANMMQILACLWWLWCLALLKGTC